MEKKILVYDDNGTESEEFRTMLAQLSSQFQGHGLRFRFKQIYNLKGGLDAWQEAVFQTVKVNTRALTLPLPSFTTSSQLSAPLQTSTPVTTLTTSTSTSTPVVITSATTSASASASSPPTPTASVPLSSSHSQTPGFETLPTVIGLFIGMVFMAGFLWQEEKRKDTAIGGDKNE